MLAFITRKLSQVTGMSESQTDIPPENDLHDANNEAPTESAGTGGSTQAAPPKGEDVEMVPNGVDEESSAAKEKPTPAQVPQDILQPLRPTPHSISARVKKIPAKTFHEYMLSHVATADEATLKSLASFLEDVKPPPKLHCVRCHKDFTEVENDDRSCLVPHDDESAEVERVGRAGDLRTTGDSPASSYQTLWGCCGKVTDGDGSHGPPDGWCYEGKHTVCRA